ncbi:Protein phosphatase 2C 2 [Mortierella sp. NVP85]|nr:Protein phosphatase 2C 2 [Mortierella sp. NVP85]
MEDAHTTLLDVEDATGTAFFAVYDGHGDEYIRIVSAGGSVESGRINCGIGLSRALGDFGLKSNSLLELEQQILIANPDVKEHKLTDEDEFLVLACDGIWDCMTSKQVIKFIRREIADGTPLDKTCEKIMDSCLATEVKSSFIGCDNMTMIIVAFLNGRTIQEWQEHICQRVSAHVKPTNTPNGSSSADIGGITPGSGKRTSRFYSRLPRWLQGRNAT